MPAIWLQTTGLFALGGLASLGWAPFAQPVIAFAATAIFAMFLVNATTFWKAVAICMAYALGFHWFGHGWIFQVLLTQTMAGPALSLLGSVTFIVYLCLFTLIPGLLFHMQLQRSTVISSSESSNGGRPLKWMDSVVFATLFTGGEYARSLLLNGFTSLSAGYLFSDWPLRGWVPIFGVYGCSFLFYLTAFPLASKCREALRTPTFNRHGLISYAIVVTVVFLGGWLDKKTWTHPFGTPITYRLIQGSVAQSDKFSPAHLRSQTEHYIQSIIEAPADIVGTPETAFTSGIGEVPHASLNRLKEFSASTRSNLFLGAPSISSNGNAFNSLYHIAPDRPQIARYDKIHLMPFGEYAPTGFQSFTDSLSIHLSNLSAGRMDQAPLTISTATNTVSIGPLICSDDQTGKVAEHWSPQVNLLFSAGNLAWFEGSIAIQQMLQVARVRAIESGRPMLRVANTGVTAHIDQHGRVIAQLDTAGAGVLSGEVQPMRGSTPFSEWGGLLFVGLFGLVALSARLMDRRKNLK